jgi:7,8-dihydropterin-6-yl-methyl-4-(beta-D-ribofuranosyl)aminobenzene 5'-phosphate synthase
LVRIASRKGDVGVKLTIIYDNTTLTPDLQPDWGFACVLELPENTVLFDTGTDPDILMANMGQLGFSPTDFDALMISHDHYDHTGGLDAVLAANSNVTVVCPSEFAPEFKERIFAHGAELREIGGAQEVLPGLMSTGNVGRGFVEHAAVLRVDDGMLVVTGCAHPGVAEMVAQGRAAFEWDVDLVLGGFHLMDAGRSEIADVIGRLQKLGVPKAAPCHCTGADAIETFAEIWEDGFVRVGAGWSAEWTDPD